MPVQHGAWNSAGRTGTDWHACCADVDLKFPMCALERAALGDVPHDLLGAKDRLQVEPLALAPEPLLNNILAVRRQQGRAIEGESPAECSGPCGCGAVHVVGKGEANEGLLSTRKAAPEPLRRSSAHIHMFTWNRRSRASQGPILSANGLLAGLLDMAWDLTTAVVERCELRMPSDMGGHQPDDCAA